MGSSNSPIEVNNRFVKAINELDFSTIHHLIHTTNPKLFYPELLHYAVCSNQLDLVAILIDQSKNNI